MEGREMQLKKGDRFTHKHWLNSATNKPLECVVTKVARGCVYYRADYGQHDDGTPWLGSPAYFSIDQTPRYVA
jgi:hypothetical protein